MLSAPARKQVLVPPKHGVAHLVLADSSVLHYKQSEYYNSKRQITYRWDEERCRIWWPIKNPSLSQRDELGYYV
jgi:dTDP-4-dehydrorhamnose 3,5-epimerase